MPYKNIIKGVVSKKGSDNQHFMYADWSGVISKYRVLVIFHKIFFTEPAYYVSHWFQVVYK